MFESIIRLFTTIAPDFRVLWLASHDLFSSSNPYLNPNIFTGVGYPPNSLIFYLPLTIFDYLTAQNIFTVISVVCLIFCLYVTFKIINIKNNYLFIILLFLTLLSFPTKFTLGMGQNNFIGLLLLLLSFYLFKIKKLYQSGILLGLAISLKTIFLYFLIYYLIKKQWKLIFSVLLVLILSIVTIYIIRSDLSLYGFYIKKVLPPLFRFEDREIYYNQGVSGFVSRIINNVNLRKILTDIISTVLVLINIYFVKFKKNTNLSFSLTVLTLLLIDNLSWQHHFVWLIFPFMVILKTIVKSSGRLLIIFAYILISINVPGVKLLSSNLFWGTMILYGMNIKYLK